MPNRHGSSNSYRYGFQGQEKDDELKGEGNSLNYTFRMHDPRVGRFFATDPLENDYPWYSPYQFGGNSTLMSVELEGLEESKTANENQNSKKELGIFEHVILGFINIFDTWSKVKDVNKYEGNTLEEKALNSFEGFKEFGTTDTFLFLGAMNQPGFRIDLDDSGDDIARLSSRFKNFNSNMATKYLKSVGQLQNFETVDGFAFSFGNLRYMYQNSINAAKNGNWWTNQKFKSSLEAFDYLALDYSPDSNNLAQYRFAVRVFGFSVKGTASPQGTTMGTGVQYMGVKLNNIIPTKSGSFRLSKTFIQSSTKNKGGLFEDGFNSSKKNNGGIFDGGF